MAARLIRRVSRLLAVPVSFQPLPSFVPSECMRIAQLAPSFPCQAALHTSPLCRLSDSLPEVSSESLKQGDEDFFAVLKEISEMGELLDIGSKKSLSGNRGVMVLQEITNRTSEDSDKVLNDPRLQELLKNINVKIEHVWNIRLLKLLKCLYALGMRENDYNRQSVEIEVRWRLRRLSIGSLSYLSSFITQESTLKSKRNLFDDLVKEVELRWTEIKDVRTLVTLTCKLGAMSDSLMEKLEDKILEFAEHFTPEESRRILSQLAAQNRRTLSVLQALSFHLLQHNQELSQSIMADLAFAYAKLNFVHPQMLQKMAADIISKLPDTKPSAMALIVRSYAYLRYANLPLCEAVAQECIKSRESFNNGQLCSILFGFALLNFQPGPNEEFFSVIHQWLDSEFYSLSLSQQLGTVWSLCILSHATMANLQNVLERRFYIQVLEDSSVRIPSLCLKFLHINATAMLESPGYQGPLLSKEVLKALQKKIPLKVAKPLQVGTREVLKTVFPTDGACNFGVNTIYGSHLDCELVLDSEFNAIPINNFVAPLNEQDGETQPLPEGLRRIAIVTQEFSHYIYRGKDLLGQYQMVRRHLQAAGFLVVEVPYYEWQEMKSDWQKQYFLKEQIKKVVTMEDSGL